MISNRDRPQGSESARANDVVGIIGTLVLVSGATTHGSRCRMTPPIDPAGLFSEGHNIIIIMMT